jgi:DNA (cytosine-5)-methyltransferase 1
MQEGAYKIGDDGMKQLTHFSLFGGIGGIDLAAEWAGFETVGQCEWADYPTKVLEKHWPDVPRWRDIRSVTAKSFYERTGLRTIDLISGGFPCQPFSVAGKRKGKDDDRYLWPEMLRVIQELQPTWVLGENVAGIVSMALDTVLTDLESLNYSTQAFIIPACAVGALHRRDRTFIIANTNIKRPQGRKKTTFVEKTDQQLQGLLSTDLGSYISESKANRNNYGIPFWMDRLKCLGNAVVPQQVYPILQAIADIERSIQCK